MPVWISFTPLVTRSKLEGLYGRLEYHQPLLHSLEEKTASEPAVV